MTTVYLNGDFVEQDDARIPAESAGVLFGRGVYETFRARRGCVFLLERHVSRLRDGAEVVGVDVPEAVAELADIVGELTDRCGIEDARVRLTLAAAVAGRSPSTLIQARPTAVFPEALYERGMAAVVSDVRRNETSPLSRVKSLNCLDSIMSHEAAIAAGFDTGLLLNTRDNVAEASISNVFIVRDGAIVTPPVKDGALPGVTRSFVLEEASDTTLTLNDLLSADEAFLTNAVMGVMPLVRIGDQPIADGSPGVVSIATREKFERLFS